MSSKNDREPGPANTREGMRRRTLLLSTTSLVAASGISATAPSAQAQQPQEILPKPAPAFQGKIGRTVKDSTPDFPKSVEAPGGARPGSCPPLYGEDEAWLEEHAAAAGEALL